MLSPKSFRYQIVLTFSIIFAALWGGSIFIFKNYITENFTEEQQANYRNYQKTIQQEVKKLNESSQHILKTISSQLSNNSATSTEVIKEIWDNNLLKPDDINFSHYDNNHKYTEISQNYESYFYSPLMLDKSVISPYSNLIEGGSFFHCQETCRFHYIKPVSNSRFDQGVFQISLSLNKITTRLLDNFGNIDIFILKKNLIVTSYLVTTIIAWTMPPAIYYIRKLKKK